MPLAALGGHSLTDDVAVQLRAAVLGGGHLPGQRLPTEAVLCSQLNVSRSVLREALSQLKAEGLLLSHRGRGTFIADPARSSALRFSTDVPARDALQHWFELRAIVEIGAAVSASVARKAADLRRIEAALRKIDQAIAEGESGGLADVELHFAIAEATHNPYFVDLLNFLQTRLTEAIATSWENSRVLGHGPYPAQVEHQRVVAAIKSGDPEAARVAARIHLQNAAARMGLKKLAV